MKEIRKWGELGLKKGQLCQVFGFKIGKISPKVQPHVFSHFSSFSPKVSSASILLLPGNNEQFSPITCHSLKYLSLFL
jgi:hypothetical protein